MQLSKIVWKDIQDIYIQSKLNDGFEKYHGRQLTPGFIPGKHLFLIMLNMFGVDVMQVSNINEVHEIELSDLCTKYSEMFEPAMVVVKNIKATIFLKSSATSFFMT